MSKLQLVSDLRDCAALHVDTSLIYQLMHDAADALDGKPGKRIPTNTPVPKKQEPVFEQIQQQLL